jgi:hypothetical protein
MATATQNVNDSSGPLPRFTKEVSGIIREAAEASRSTPPGDGMERGGLLLAVPDGNDFKIDRVEMVPCEHRYGPEYRLSPDDLNVLRAKAEEVRASGLRRVVGYVRTSSRDPLGFSLDENAVIREFVADCDWFVIAKSFPDGRCRVRAFRYIESGWAQAADFALPGPSEPLAVPYRQPPLWFRATSTALDLLGTVPPFVTGILALIVVAWVGWSCFLNRPAPIPPNLGMRVASDGNMVGLSWDARPALGNSARSGILHIRDGSQQSDVSLDAGKVANGLVLYKPESADVTFQLELQGASPHPVEDSVHWVGRPDELAAAGFTVNTMNPAPANPAPAAATPPAEPVSKPNPPKPLPAVAKPSAGEGLARFVVKTPGARVTVQPADNPHAPERPVRTDSLRLPAGQWIVRATAPGYKPFSRHFLVNKAGPAEILIRMQPANGA